MRGPTILGVPSIYTSNFIQFTIIRTSNFPSDSIQFIRTSAFLTLLPEKRELLEGYKRSTDTRCRDAVNLQFASMNGNAGEAHVCAEEAIVATLLPDLATCAKSSWQHAID